MGEGGRVPLEDEGGRVPLMGEGGRVPLMGEGGRVPLMAEGGPRPRRIRLRGCCCCFPGWSLWCYWCV